MPVGRDNKTRKDYLVKNVFGPVFQRVEGQGNVPDGALPDPKEQAAEYLQREDELIWAWSRDPRTDLTQIEARDRAQDYDYGRYNVSQSTVSRKLNSLDERMLTEPVRRLTPVEPTEDGGRALLDIDAYDAYERYCQDLLEVYQATLARFLCDLHALDAFSSGEERTPAWAQERFPGLDPDLGRTFYRRQGWDDEVQLHPPTGGTPAQGTAVDD